jgi:hypothetical protein
VTGFVKLRGKGGPSPSKEIYKKTNENSATKAISANASFVIAFGVPHYGERITLTPDLLAQHLERMRHHLERILYWPCLIWVSSFSGRGLGGALVAPGVSGMVSFRKLAPVRNGLQKFCSLLFLLCVVEGTTHQLQRMVTFGDPWLGGRVVAHTRGPLETQPGPHKLKLFRKMMLLNVLKQIGYQFLQNLTKGPQQNKDSANKSCSNNIPQHPPLHHQHHARTICPCLMQESLQGRSTLDAKMATETKLK